MRYTYTVGGVALGCLAAAMLTGCGGNQTEYWDTAIKGQTPWEDLSPARAFADGPAEGQVPTELTESIGAKEFKCTVTTNSLTETPREFVAINPDKSIIWVGNLIQGASHYNVGSLKELSIRERAPLKISIDLLKKDNTRTIEAPSMTSVQSAIGDLVERAVAEGHEASSSASYEWEMAHSAEEASLKLGFSGEYLGASASASLEVDAQGDERSYIAYFVQRAFTVSMELPERPGAVLGKDFTEADYEALRDEGVIGPDNPPLFLSNVTYGRILIYRMTSSASEQSVAAAISASYDGAYKADGEMESDVKETLENAKISISTFGGNQSNLDALIRSGKLRDYFTGDTKLTSMEPISFELRRLADRDIASITRTTEYDVKECKYVSKPIGEKVAFTIEKIEIPGDCDVGANAGDVYGKLTLNWTNSEGKLKSTTVMNIGRNNHVKVQSGNALSGEDIHGKTGRSTFAVQRMYGKANRFELKGEVKEFDNGALGADDQIGAWKFNLSKTSEGQLTKRAHGSTCYPGNANQPRLHYRLNRTDYIYPPEE